MTFNVMNSHTMAYKQTVFPGQSMSFSKNGFSPKSQTRFLQRMASKTASTVRCEATPTQVSEKADSYKLLETAFEDYRRAPPSEVTFLLDFFYFCSFRSGSASWVI